MWIRGKKPEGALARTGINDIVAHGLFEVTKEVIRTGILKITE